MWLRQNWTWKRGKSVSKFVLLKKAIKSISTHAAQFDFDLNPCGSII